MYTVGKALLRPFAGDWQPRTCKDAEVLNLKVKQARARLELRARATLREDGFLYNDAYAEILGDKHLALEHRTAAQRKPSC